MLVVSTGCPAGVGPEVSIRAAATLRGTVAVLVGDAEVLASAAESAGIASSRLKLLDCESDESVDAVQAQHERLRPKAKAPIYVLPTGPALSTRDRRPLKRAKNGSPVTARAGAAQLEYIDAAYRLVQGATGRALVTAPVSKAAVVGSGLTRARRFLGHTEWLQSLDGAKSSVMCFAAPGKLVSGLVTTHLPISKVPRALSAEAVAESAFQLGMLLRGLGQQRPTVLVCSLNPHAGESELLGREEKLTIVPGIALAKKRLGRRARVIGPVGAETAFRQAHGEGDVAVLAMYHDQATIPMKLVAFGEGVNVTMGLSIVRTSVDHGTAYDIAGTGQADPLGMQSAMELARRLVASR